MRDDDYPEDRQFLEREPYQPGDEHVPDPPQTGDQRQAPRYVEPEAPPPRKTAYSDLQPEQESGYVEQRPVEDMEGQREQSEEENELLLVVRPSWLCYFWHFCFFWLVIPPAVAIWQRFSTRVRVFEDRLAVSRGLLGTNLKVIFLADIRTIDIQQSLWQRMFGFGRLKIATAGTARYEEVLSGIADPIGVKDLLLKQRKKFVDRLYD